MSKKKQKNNYKKIQAIAAAFMLFALFFMAATCAPTAIAAPPPGATTAPYTISYSGKLTGSTGTPVTTAQSIRFSIWTDADHDATDILPGGTINPAAAGFTGWQETHTVTPDANGLFNIQLGSFTTMPNFTSATQVFLQVDIKPSASPDTSYEVLDPDGNTANLTDRFPINSTPYAINADTVDNADTGTGAGNIPVLGAGGKLSVNVIPGATTSDLFILDFDNSVVAPGSIVLQFGNILAKFLEYDTGAGWFHFNDSLHVTGNISATGNLSAAGIVDFSASTEFHIREVADKSLAVCTTVNELVLDTTEDRIYVCTAPGSPGTWTSSVTPAQNKSIVFEPLYADAVFTPDGSNNKGTLENFFSDTDGTPGNANYNYYRWGTTLPAMQDMDLVIRAYLPQDFISFQPVPVELIYRTNTANLAENRLDIAIEDTAGVSVPLIGAAALNSTTFTTANITFGGAPAFTAGNAITIKIKLSATSAGAAYAARLKLNYIGQ